MVELAQDKENKSRDVVEAMKGEVTILSKTVETGNAMAFTQDTSLQAVQDEIKTLQREVKMQRDQIATLISDVENSGTSKLSTRAEIDQLKTEQDELTAELGQCRTAALQVEENTQQLQRTILETKGSCGDFKNQMEENHNRSGQQRRRNRKLQEQLINQQRNIKDAEEESKAEGERIAVLVKVLDGKKKSQAKIQETGVKVKVRITKQEAKVAEFQKEIVRWEKECGKSGEELEKAKQVHKSLQDDMDKTHIYISALRNEQLRLGREMNRQEAKITAITRTIDLVERHIQKGRSNITEERKMRGAVEGQTDSIENDLLVSKSIAHRNRMTVESLKGEIERYFQIGSENRSNFLILDSDIKIKEAENSELLAALSRIRERIAKQVSMAEQVMQQRDFVLHQLELVQAECAQMEGENKFLVTDIRRMKDLIREKDAECVQSHLKKKNVDLAITRLTRETNEWEEKVRDALQEQCTLENTLMRSRYLSEVAETDLAMLGRGNQKLETDHRLFELAVHKKTAEGTNMKDKVMTVTSSIKAEADTYRQAVKNVDTLLNSLQNELATLDRLRTKTSHLSCLKLECLRLEKGLIQARGKVRALEDELETPMNIHRWRFLEGTNPEGAQMIKMTHVLRSKCMLKSAVLQRYRLELSRLSSQADKLASHLHAGSREEHSEAMKYFDEVLRQKSRQLNQLTGQISGQTEWVQDSKMNVDVVRSQLRDTKGEYFSRKKATDALRSQSNLQRRLEARSHALNDPLTKFIGGGFAVALTQRTQAAPLSQTQRPVISPENSPVMVPKVARGSASAMSPKLLPKAWNPNRGPLHPLLPTVSELGPVVV
jgi:chromosome segregation ATPase